MTTSSKAPNRTKVNLWVDLAIFIVFLVTTAPRFSGLAIHEWLSLAFAGAIIAHLLLHWQWIAAATGRFFAKLPRQSRINYVLNALLFIDVTLIMFTGIAISREALPLLGLTVAPNFTWRRLHGLTSDIALILLGLHIALHWEWVLNAVSRYVLRPLTGRGAHDVAGRPAVAVAPRRGEDAR